MIVKFDYRFEFNNIRMSLVNCIDSKTNNIMFSFLKRVFQVEI